MKPSQLDAERRIADVKKAIAQQLLVRSELRSKGLPVEPSDRLIKVLRCCLIIIETLQSTDDADVAPSADTAVQCEAA